jgi:uncharacterized membrane protein
MKKTIPDLAARWLGRHEAAISEEESRVLQSAIDRKPISRNINASLANLHGVGDQLADGIARVGGSWTFILSFIGFLIVWTLGNIWFLGSAIFDPYPFIFLNLVLSMIAALQAPVIMMSQNRAAERDRIDAGHDYEVNLKAEIEIMALHEKLDELRHQDILIMRDEISQLSTLLKRLEARLGTETPPQ